MDVSYAKAPAPGCDLRQVASRGDKGATPQMKWKRRLSFASGVLQLAAQAILDGMKMVKGRKQHASNACLLHNSVPKLSQNSNCTSPGKGASDQPGKHKPCQMNGRTDRGDAKVLHEISEHQDVYTRMQRSEVPRLKIHFLRTAAAKCHTRMVASAVGHTAESLFASHVPVTHSDMLQVRVTLVVSRFPTPCCGLQKQALQFCACHGLDQDSNG